MRVLIFDTETTGLYSSSEKDITKQPHLVQFAGIILEGDGWKFKEVDRVNWLCKPPISIPMVTSKIHHIYDIDVRDSPTAEELLPKITELINNCDIIVGHNIKFDLNILGVEIDRLKMKGVPIDLQIKRSICTMEESKERCAIRKGSGVGFKRPTLQELCKRAVGSFFVGAHDAMVDVEWTTKAFVSLRDRGVFSKELNPQNTLF